ncbi:MAG TPA: sulfite exporter TauE/SafE family protein [Bacillota bacterium]|nr:sulfite exporter TauE/SafE family protein [Bacillota bacterium]
MRVLVFILVGFLAQMIDGALGMAYGVSSTTFLLISGISPVVASASVHTSEVFTTFVSGISHFSLKNVDLKLFKKLVIPGVMGGIVGAYLLTNIPGDAIKPYVNGYLILMGLIILVKAFKPSNPKAVGRLKAWGLGLVGGFFDAIGGGGWGPIVTSSLVASGQQPHLAVGTVNTAEFFVTVAQAATFVTLMGVSRHWQAIAGLAIGGVVAAPIAAFGCKKIAPKTLMIIVGLLICFLNIQALVKLFLK